MMLVEFSIVPVGAGESLSDKIANIIRIVESSKISSMEKRLGKEVKK